MKISTSRHIYSALLLETHINYDFTGSHTYVDPADGFGKTVYAQAKGFLGFQLVGSFLAAAG